MSANNPAFAMALFASLDEEMKFVSESAGFRPNVGPTNTYPVRSDPRPFEIRLSRNELLGIVNEDTKGSVH
jgi:hypothetical protein